jgi:hypothetical protein
MISFSTGQLRKKNLVCTNKKFVFFFNCSILEISLKKMVKRSHEFVRYKIDQMFHYIYPDLFHITLHFLFSDQFCSKVDGIPLWLKQAALHSLDFFVRLENCQKNRPKDAHSDDLPAHLAHISI